MKVESLLSRCELRDFGMGTEPFDFFRERARDFPEPDLGTIKQILCMYKWVPLLLQLDKGQKDYETYLANGVEFDVRHNEYEAQPGFEFIEAVVWVPHRDHPEERLRVYTSVLVDPTVNKVPMPLRIEFNKENLVRGLIEHELFENFLLDGVRVFDPHANDPPKALVVL